MLNSSKYLLGLYFLSLFTISQAQVGKIAGRVVDAKSGETVIGASVVLVGNESIGSITDIDGNYLMENVPIGTHTIACSYLAYSTKKVENITVTSSTVTDVNLTLEEESQQLTEVVVTATAKRESMSSVMLFQKNNVAMADGISAETIKRTPDRTSGDVIRRVSGASIQDGRFAVIRGLNDRYNNAMLNGALMSSTEPDRKAFSFDLIPSALLDNMIVMKTASADLPGEFAGGIIMVNTKDIPDENYVSATVGIGYNTVTTGRDFNQQLRGNTDWLGFDDGTRAIPSNIPESNSYKSLNRAAQIDVSKNFNNTYAISQGTAAPNTSVQVTAGLLNKLSENAVLGTTFGLTYNNSNRLQIARRFDYDNVSTLLQVNDTFNTNNILAGALLNTSLRLYKNQKINFTSSLTNSNENNLVTRSGRDNESSTILRTYLYDYTQTKLFSNRLSGEHLISEKAIKLNWGLGYNKFDRNFPDFRRLNYNKSQDDEFDNSVPFRATIGSAGDPSRAGKFYSTLDENVYNGNFDVSVPFKLGKEKQIVKFGYLHQSKDRIFNARNFGYAKVNASLFNDNLSTASPNEIFDVNNFNANGFFMDEITSLADRYDANANLNAGFVMLDNKIGKKLRVGWGVRFESFQQNLNSQVRQDSTLNLVKKYDDFLPSANITYSLTEKMNLRFSGSRTVARPEFRELAPFSFFDFVQNSNIFGSPNLERTTIDNLDLRYEIYPGANQMFSVSAFWKNFKNPIEQTVATDVVAIRLRSFANVPSAQVRGLEMEFRNNLEFTGIRGFENLTVFGNGSLIFTEIDLSNSLAWNKNRGLQGQSPYLINVGTQYFNQKIGFGTTILFNRIGDRIADVGNSAYADIYERHRNVFDLQFSQKIFKRKGEIKLTLQDLFAASNDIIFYQDQNKNHNFNEGQDLIINRVNVGTNINVSLNYRF
jgi:TonB-dependent receptor